MYKWLSGRGISPLPCTAVYDPRHVGITLPVECQPGDFPTRSLPPTPGMPFSHDWGMLPGHVTWYYSRQVLDTRV